MHWSKTKNRELIIEKLRIAKIGERNHRWKPTVTYSSVHVWLWTHHRHIKKFCKNCGKTTTLEFALKKGMEHDRNTRNYLILCDSCHKKYDYTDDRKAKLSKALKGRKITWVTNPNHDEKGRFAHVDTKKLS